MSKDPRKLFEQLDEFAKATEQEMQAVARQFEERIRSLTSEAGSTPSADWHERIAEEGARFQTRNEAKAAALHAEVGRLKRDGVPRAPHARFRASQDRLRTRRRRPPKPPSDQPEAGGVLVWPDGPSGLSGGGAAPLELE